MSDLPEEQDAADEPADIKVTDIVFDCPHCGKSLVIDYHGAGLAIQCTDCGNDVAVPIPEGMEVEDSDSNEEDQEMRILKLRHSLSAAESQIAELEGRVVDLTAGQAVAQKARLREEDRLRVIQEKVQSLHGALDQIARAARSISELSRST
jgi:transcription elongation factor Elf1